MYPNVTSCDRNATRALHRRNAVSCNEFNVACFLVFKSTTQRCRYTSCGIARRSALRFIIQLTNIATNYAITSAICHCKLIVEALSGDQHKSKKIQGSFVEYEMGNNPWKNMDACPFPSIIRTVKLRHMKIWNNSQVQFRNTIGSRVW